MAESEAVADIPMNVKISGKLKDAILAKLAASNPALPAVSSDFVHLRLQQFFQTPHTPIHPPYSLMIQQAILKLNEKGGSREEAISRFIEKEYEGLPWGHASFLSHHLKKLCRDGDIVSVNDERYMLRVDDDDGDLRYEEKEEKEDKNSVRVKGREVEGIDGWSGVNGDRAEESVDQSEVRRQSVGVDRNAKARGQRIVGFEEQKEGKQQLIKAVREESQNFGGSIEGVEEVNVAKAKLFGVDQEQRGKSKKQPEMSEQQIKVLKDDIPQAMMEEEKKYIGERQQQTKGASGVMKSIVSMIGEQERPQEGKVSDEQGHPQDKEIDVRTKMSVSSSDREDGKNLKAPFGGCSAHPLEEEKMEVSEHERPQKRKLHHQEKNSIIVCALPAQRQSQLRRHIYQKAHKLSTDTISASHESRESRHKTLKLIRAQRAAKLQVSASGMLTRSKQKPVKIYIRRRDVEKKFHPKVKTSFDVSKNLEELEEKQEQGFHKPEKLRDIKLEPKEENVSGEEAALSLSMEVKGSMNAPLDLEQHGREQRKMLKVYVRRKVSYPKLPILCQ